MKVLFYLCHFSNLLKLTTTFFLDMFFLKLLFCDLDLTACNGRRKQKNTYLRPIKQFL